MPRKQTTTTPQSKVKINLKDIQYYIINLEEDIDRKEFMDAQMKELGLKYQFVPGVKVKPRPIGIALSHLKILKMKDLQRPFVVLEDDCQFYIDRFKSEIFIPEATDGIYLGHSTFGVRDIDQYGLRWGKHRSTKYELYDNEYIRILSMLSRHAIIYLSDKFHQNAIKANQKALLNYDFPYPGDMAYAEIQSDHLLLAPYEPWCYQSEKHYGNHPATKNSLLKEIKPTTDS